MKRLALLFKRGVLTALTLLCLAQANASVRMYVVWQPTQNGAWQRADSGSTIGGAFTVYHGSCASPQNSSSPEFRQGQHSHQRF